MYMANLPDRPRPESESGKGERQEPGAGGTRRDGFYHAPENLMRAAWWWIDRWRQSAAYRDLTPEQKGMYRDLLDEVWLRDDHVIPDDDRVLGLIVGDPDRWRVLRDSILCRFTRAGAGWTHDTALEVIAQSKTRADRQKRYRDSKRNADHNAERNGGDNRGRSPSPSPSPSLTNGRTEERPTAPANPLIAGRRPEIEKDGYRLIREINALEPDRDPTEILLEAAKWQTKEGGFRSKVRLETMTDDHLIRTVHDLKATLEEAKAHGTETAKRRG
jgi:uncharacterized protein YdaU (DUF1376 family)